MVRILFFALGSVREPLEGGRTVVPAAARDGEAFAYKVQGSGLLLFFPGYSSKPQL